MDKSQKCWEKQTSSRHRFGDAGFYQSKAREHAALITDEHKIAGCIDIGCGAGELLEYLSAEVNVNLGLDYSDTMLAEARKRLAGRNITLVKADIFDYLPGQNQKVWITCGAINQYLDIKRQRKFLELFTKHQSVETLYLFDCVDPIRYSLLNFGIGYIEKPVVRESNAMKKLLRALLLKMSRFTMGVRLAAGMKLGVCQKIGGQGMGYGFLPKFWIDECKKRDLRFQIISSRFYEYRYHVIINKK